MSNPQRLNTLPKYAPIVATLCEVRGAEFLPFSIYNQAGIPENDLESLVVALNTDNIFGTKPNGIYLVRCAPKSMPRLQTLSDIVAAHIEYCEAHVDKLEYFPFGFMVVHDRNLNAKGLYLVYIDFEEPFEVTGFRLSIEDVATAADTRGMTIMELRKYVTYMR